MRRLPPAVALRGRAGALFHVGGGLLIWLLWRFTGLSSIDDMGLLVPLAWILAGVLHGKGGVPRLSAPLLGLHALFAFLWMSGGPSMLLARASALGALLPGILAIALDGNRRLTLLRCAIPILPLAVLAVPFSGDEPFHASLAEHMISPDSETFGGFTHQRGDPTDQLTHLQPLCPLFLVPGCPFGIPGVRTITVLMALGSAALLGILFRRGGIGNRRMAVLLFLGAMPGIGILGTVYPIWMALVVFLAAAIHVMRTRSYLWIILAIVVLGMIKLRFAPLGFGLAAASFAATPGRRKYRVLLVTLGGLALFLALDHFLLGGRIFWVRYGNADALRSLLSTLVFRPHEALFAAVGTLLDVEAGLLWKAPWIFLALAGIPRLRREHPELFRWLGLPALFYLVALLLWAPTDWHGSPTPAGRMLMPVIPFLLASMTMTLRNRSAGVLIALSLAVSAVLATSPGLRFNDADGSDSILTALTATGNPAFDVLPSIVRPGLAPFLAFGVAALLLLLVAARERGNAALLLLPLALLLGALSRRTQTSWEAEDLPPTLVRGCDYYPANMDPFLRKFWFECRQVFLAMGAPGDEVRIPVPDSFADSLTLRIHYRTLLEARQPWILVEHGGRTDTLRLLSSRLDPPARFLYVTSGEKKAENEPGNMQELIAELPLADPGGGDVIVLRPLFPTEDSILDYIYLDRLELLR